MRSRHPRDSRDQQEHRLVFPAQALELARRTSPSARKLAAQSAAGTLAANSNGRCELIESIDQTLEHMDQRLRALREDVESMVFRLPQRDDSPPPRAA
ncbi:MAG: hypothetical protein K2X32_11905 [Phycisphaerales bacterium]|nr:hypothetical protein [Phycisphaerales bacterium]